MTKVCPQCAQTYDASLELCPADGALLRHADPLVGTTLDGRYLITERLGEGGMGRVYRAKHVRLGREAAIKVLSPSYLSDPDSRHRFTCEAELLIRVDSEHVARVYDFGELPDGQLYLALEFVAGQSLSAVMRGAPLPPERVADVARQLGAGLDAVHKCGLVHRDIKPDNVMLARASDGRDVVKLIDFGIARSTSGTGHITRTGMIIGTPEFMSPEQVLGETLDARTDVFAFGVLAVVMLTGKLPFPNETFEQALASRLMGGPRRLQELAPEVEWPASVQQPIDRALARDPAARYATAGEFAAELESAIDAWRQKRPRVAAAAAAYPRPRPRVIAGVTMATILMGALVGFALTARSGDRAVVATGDVDAAVQAPRPRPPEGSGATSKDLVVAPQAAPLRRPTDAAPRRTPEPSDTRPAERARPLVDTGQSRPSSSRQPPHLVDVGQQLNRIEKALDPADVTPSVARAALAELAAVLPRVRTHDDSMRAGLLAFQAHLHADELEPGCELLRAIDTLATRENYRETARIWLDRFCK